MAARVAARVVARAAATVAAAKMAMAATMRARRGRGLRVLLCSRARPGASSILAQHGSAGRHRARARVGMPALSHRRDQSRAWKARMVAPVPRAHHEEVAGAGPTKQASR